MIRSIVFILMLLGTLAVLHNAHAQDIFLIQAKVDSFRATAQDFHSSDDVDVGAWFDVRLSDIQPLIGQFRPPRDNIILKITSLPTSEKLKHIYILGRRLPDSQYQTIDWNYVLFGLCIDHELAKIYSIEDDLRKLRQGGRVRWNADCDW